LHTARYRWDQGIRVLGSLRIFFRHIRASDSGLATLQRAIDSWPEEDSMLRSAFRNRSLFVDMVSEPLPGAGPTITRILFHPMWLASMRRALPAFDEPIALAQRPWAERWTAVEQHQGEMTRRFGQQRRSGWRTWVTDPFAVPFTWSTVWIRQSAYDLAA